MKKIMLVALAAVFAVGFSAFSPASEKTVDSLFYKVTDESGTTWYPIEAEPCPVGLNNCVISTPLHGFQQVYDDINGNPLKRQ